MAAMSENAALRAEELEALEAIYGDELSRGADGQLMLRVGPRVVLRLFLPDDYLVEMIP